jgi:hypothetical protein
VVLGLLGQLTADGAEAGSSQQFELEATLAELAGPASVTSPRRAG